MAPSAEQIRTEAYESAMAAGTRKVRDELHKKFAYLVPLIGGNVKLPETEEEWDRMASQVINKGSITVTTGTGKKTVDLNEINAKLPEGEKLKIPSHADLNQVSMAIGDGAATGFGSMLMNFIQGAFKWLMNGGLKTLFSEGFGKAWEGIKQSVAEVAAERMHDSVDKRLHGLRDEKPELAYLLSDKTITDISQTVKNKALKAGGIAVPEVPLSSEPVVIEEVSQSVRDKISERVYQQARLSINGALIDATKKEIDGLGGANVAAAASVGVSALNTATKWSGLSWVGKKLGVNMQIKNLPNPEDFAVVEEKVARDIQAIMQPDFSYKGKTVAQMNPKELAEATQVQVEATLKANRGSIPSFNDTMIADVAKQVATKMESEYDQLPMIPDNKTIALANAAAAAARDAGVSGARETRIVQAPITGATPGEQTSRG
jgi:hypothetical protein